MQNKKVVYFLLIAVIFSSFPTQTFAEEDLSVSENVSEAIVTPTEEGVEEGSSSTQVAPGSEEESASPTEESLTPEEQSKEEAVEEGVENSSESENQSLLSGDPEGIPKDSPQQYKLPNVDQSSGALNYSYAFALPPFRGNSGIDLSLSYNSQATYEQNQFGYGWSLSIPNIERVNKIGINKLYSSNQNEWYFRSSLDGELILSPSSGGVFNYTPRTEQGNFNKYTFDSNTGTWTIKLKNGNTIILGETSGSRLVNSANANQIFRWYTDKITDTNNNSTVFTYTKDLGYVYPAEIEYSKNLSNAGIYSVSFTLENRLDATPSYEYGFAVTNQKRVKNVSVYVTNPTQTKIHNYNLTYTVGINGARSLLSSVQHTGYDTTGNDVVLPATEFSYQSDTPDPTYGRFQQKNITLPSGFLINTDTEIGDINGDGFMDLVRSIRLSCSVDEKKVAINNGNGDFAISGTYIPSTYFHDYCNSQNGYPNNTTRVRLMDINGDGKADVIGGPSMSGNNVWINDGNNWVEQGRFLDIKKFADVNADGLPDFSDRNNFNIGVDPTPVFLNTGNGWIGSDSSGTDSPKLTNGLLIPGFNPEGANHDGIMDLNNDTFPDFFRKYRNGNPCNLNSDLEISSPGTSPVIDANLYSPTPYYIYYYNSAEICEEQSRDRAFADINGDGWTDIVTRGRPSGGATPTPVTYINNGHWNEDSSWQFTDLFTDGHDTYGIFLDMDGDGMTDYLPLNANYYKKSTAKKPDLLINITEPTGAQSQIKYKAAVSYVNGSGLPLNTQNHLPVWTVSQVSNVDSLSPTITRNYNYKDASFYYPSSASNIADRKFAGFGVIEETDSVGNKLTTYFHQGNENNSTYGESGDSYFKIGKVYRVEKGNSSTVLERVINTWEACDMLSATTCGTPATKAFVGLARTVSMNISGSSHFDVAEEYDYNNTNGNLDTKRELGEVTVSNITTGAYVDVGTDKLTITYLYTNNSSPRLILPTFKETKDNSGNRVNKTKFWYDSLTLGFGNANKGNLIKEERWVSDDTPSTCDYAVDGTCIDFEKTYDTYGLITQEIDPRGNVTNYSYDTNNLYPDVVTKIVTGGNLVTKYNTYNYACGKPTEIEDANNLKYQTVYDGLCRVTAEKQPDLISPATLQNKNLYFYDDTPNAIRIHKTENLDSGNAIETHVQYDGFGRVIQTRVEAEVTDKYSVTDVVYNNLGQVYKKSIPYFSNGYLRTNSIEDTSPNLYITYSYDPLGRVLSEQNVIGTTSNAYSLFISSPGGTSSMRTTITDPKLHQKVISYDAFGRIKAVTEKLNNNANSYITRYSYDGNGNLKQIQDASADANIRNFVYDGVSRRIEAEDLHKPGDTTFSKWTYTYDASGNLTQKQLKEGVGSNSIGTPTNYTYDEVGRVKSENNNGQGVTYAYDTNCTYGKGNLCSVTMTNGDTSSYTYNPLGLVASETKNISAPFTTSYTYDRQGNITKIVNPDNSEVYYYFNAAGLLETIDRKEQGGTLVNVANNFEYSEDGRVRIVISGNGVRTTNAYDPNKLYRLQSKVTRKQPWGVAASGPKFQDLNYTYDNNGNILTITDSSEIFASDSTSVIISPVKKTTTFGYDDLNRLTSAVATNVASGQNTYEQTFAYDILGNINSRTEKVGSNDLSTWDYQYEGDTGSNYANPHAVTKVAGNINPDFLSPGQPMRAFTYDKFGNVEREEKTKLSPSWYQKFGWGYRKKVNVSGNIAANGTVNNFPLLVSVQDDELKYGVSGAKVGQPNGEDIVFTSSDGVTKLPHEIESYNGATGTLVAWVKVPTITSSGTSLFIYMGRTSGASMEDPTNVWDSNYKGVWHLEQSPSYNATPPQMSDSTSNGNNGTSYGSMVNADSVTAQIYKGLEFDAVHDGSGIDDVVKVNAGASVNNLPDLTIEGWINSTDNTNETNNGRIMDKRTSGSGWAFIAKDNNAIRFYANHASGALDVNATGINENTGWHHVAVSWDGGTTASGVKFYVDGILKTTNTTTNGSGARSDDSAQSIYFGDCGNLSTSSCALKGKLDELRLSNSVRPIEWIKASFINQDDPSTVTLSTINETITDTYTWDYNNRMLTSIVSGNNLSYAYDHTGQRTKVIGGSTTKYPTKFFNTSDTATTGNIYKHIFAGDLAIADLVSGSVNYIHADHLGGTNVMTNSSGVQSEILDYYPFGNRRYDMTSSFTEQRQFAGSEFDPGNSLNYMNARYYKGGVNRFFSQDPAFITTSFSLTDPQSFNSYAYSRNNPLRFVDPTGNWYMDVITGRQSWNSFTTEVGDAANYMYNDSATWQTALDHPYATGALIGVAGGVAAVGGTAIAPTVMSYATSSQALTGAGIGVASQALQDATAGQFSGIGTYAYSAITGAVGGGTAGGVVAQGLIGGGYNYAQQRYVQGKQDVDWGSVAISAGSTAVSTKVIGAKSLNLTTGNKALGQAVLNGTMETSGQVINIGVQRSQNNISYYPANFIGPIPLGSKRSEK